MNAKYFKRKILSVILPTLLLILSAVFALGFSNAFSAKASIGGDTSMPSGSDTVINLTMDLNGKTFYQKRDNSVEYEENKNDLTAYDGYGSRTISSSAIKSAAKDERFVRYKLDINDGATIKYNDVKNSGTAFVTNKEEKINGEECITLVAQKAGETYIRIPFNDHDTEKVVYFHITVTSSLKQRDDGESASIGGTNVRRLIVGAPTVTKNDDGSLVTDNSAESPDAEPYALTFTNNTKGSLYLGDSQDSDTLYNSILAGHKLYKGGNTAWTGNKYGDFVGNDKSDEAWTIQDVTGLFIKSITVEGLTTIFGQDKAINVSFHNVNGIAPIIQYDINIKDSDLGLGTLTESQKKTFWNTSENKGNTYKLVIEFSNTDGASPTQVAFFINFAPASEPLIKTNPSMPTELNAGAPESNRFVGQRGSLSKGFRSTVVSAKYIVEYPNPNDIYVEHVAPAAIEGSKSEDVVDFSPHVLTNGTDDNLENLDPGEKYFVVTAKSNGVAFLDFYVSYTKPDGTEDRKTVRISFTVYGKYDTFTIEIGGKTFSENINSYDKFAALRNDGYFLTDVAVENQEFATAKIEYNNLVINPRTTGTTNIILTFLSSDGNNEIDVTAFIDVDFNRGNWWRMQQDWAKALIIAAACIVGIALILFIVWLFIRGINKSKREEQETVVPTSSYIVKLNSTIAAAQAQQRFSYSGVAAPTQTLQLGAGTTSAAPPPDMGALPPTSGATVPPQTDTVMAPPPPDASATQAPPPVAEEIVIPISDEDLIERIFVEKYEPRGMTRRSFFKSKDLQNRELEKEKARIREDVKNGMSIEEACKSEKQREEEASAATGASATDATEEKKEEAQDPIVVILGFDPSAPLLTPDEEFAIVMGDGPKSHTEIDENGEEKVVLDEITEEEENLNAARAEYQKLLREAEVLKERLNKAEEEKAKLESGIGADKEKIDATNEEIKSLKEQITDIEVKLSSARGKEKDRLTREIADTEAKIENDKAQIKTTEDNIAENEKTLERLAAILESLKTDSDNNASAIVASEQKLKDCEKQAQIAAERAEKAKAAQKFEKQFVFLSPIMESVAVIDKKMGSLGSRIEQDTQRKTELKSEVSALQTQLLGTTDAAAISNMSEAIKQKNADIAQLEKNITAATKEKSDLAIELTGQKKQAIDFIEKEDMEYEKVVEAEDKVLNRLALEEMRAKAEQDKQEAEDALMLSQTVYDELVANMDASLAEKAASVAEDLQLAEQAVADAQAELDELNAKMEAASDDEKLMMSIDQMSLMERLDELKASLEEIRANGIKTNLEFKMKSEEDVKEAGEALEKAKADYESASDRISRFMSFTEATDLVASGSGLISRERKIAEEANLKKKLAEQQNAIEQAKMAAKLAQEEAERAISDAEKASAASKEEAERLAQEAIDRAEAARLEAEAKAAEEAEKAKAEIDKVKAEAAEEAEKARVEAEKKLEEAEKNRKEAESEAEKARRDAEEEALRARRVAEEEAEKAKKEADEAAEKARKEAEEEAEKAKKEAEEAEKANAAEQAEKEARLAEKIKRRKLEIAEIRRDLKTVETEAQGNELKEKFYDIQLRLDDEEKESQELKDLLDRSMNDAAHAAELARYKALANKAPKRIVKKVTERVNKVPRRNPARPGARPGAARPAARPGTRPAARPGTRPGAARPGARPAVRPGTRPAARPGTRPAARPGARPGAPRPSSGTRRPPSK